MSFVRLRAVAILVALTVATGYAFQSPRPTVRGRPACRKCRNSPALSPADALKTFYMPPGYHLELVASEPLVQDPIADGLGSRRPPLGRRDARLRAELDAPEPEPGSDRPHRRARGHQPRRPDGQAHGVRRRPGPGAGAEGARPRRARRRAAERLADARHQRRPEDGHEGARDRRSTAAARRASSRTPTASLGARQLDAHRRTATSSCGSRTASSRSRRRCRAASGA